MTIRGLWTHSSVLYEVKDNKLFSVEANGFTTERGTLLSLGGVVDFQSNLTQMVVNDGTFLYVFNPVSGAFAPAVGYPGGDRVGFLNQRVTFLIRGTQQFGWTPLGDASLIDAGDFASAEGSPDRLVSHVSAARQLWFLGEETAEVWDPSTGDKPFQVSSAAIDYGCVAAHSAQKSANSVFWLGRDKEGQAMVLQAQGHQAQRISDQSIEERFQGKALTSARAFCYSEGGQSFYCLNVPTIDTTLVWDDTFKQWHERAEWNGAHSQWRPTCHAFAYGKHYFGAGDLLYTSSATSNRYGSDVKRRQRIAPVVSGPELQRVSYEKLELICEKGTGAQVMLRFSDDNGANWSAWAYASVGTVGRFAKRARFRRLGKAFDRVFDVVMTDDAPFNPVAVDIPLA